MLRRLSSHAHWNPNDTRLEPVMDPSSRQKWLAARPKAARDEFVRRVKKDGIGVHARPFSTHTEVYSIDELVWAFKFVHQLRVQHGLDIVSAMTVCRHIFAPLSLSAFAKVFIHQFTWIWNELLIGLTLTRSENVRPIITPVAAPQASSPAPVRRLRWQEPCSSLYRRACCFSPCSASSCEGRGQRHRGRTALTGSGVASSGVTFPLPAD
ncbi:MAG: multiple sugar transport system permease protein [Thermomicrobiales bacterium]|nr:multiple sugar transport system permease protein [Thermomicrobiales bacterium]